ncbi:MAG: zinc-binding dehydrogenase [Rhizobiales bacterium]|nr:zinc-binding dehydrogenase [Hyphomicrobiales bacterium]
MKAWLLPSPGQELQFKDIDDAPPPAGAIALRMEATPMLSYLGDYVSGKLPYWFPEGPFVPGTNGVARVETIGDGVYHLRPGQRVALSPYLVARENVDEPAQILIGLTGISADCGPLLADWPNGTLAERIIMPASVVTPLDGLDGHSSVALATLGKFAVPMGGLLRGRLAAGETLIVNGANGYFGSAAVLLGLAMGAGRVVAVGRNRATLEKLVALDPNRISAASLSGEVEQDAATISKAAGGGAHLAFDMVGQASDAAATLASLNALKRGGRLVLMGSMSTPLPIDYSKLLSNNWEVIGNFMYDLVAYRRLASLVRSKLLDLDRVNVRVFALNDMPAAITAAAAMRGLDCTVIDFAT